jgi:AAA+ superfamily predicted ATPase
MVFLWLLFFITIAMHPLVGRLLEQEDEEEKSTLFATEFTLTLLDEAVVQENATVFLDAIRPDTLSLEMVRCWKQEQDLPTWNTPHASMLSVNGKIPVVHGEKYCLSEALKAIDPETPIALNDLLLVPTTQDLYMHEQVICGRIVATGDESVFGFAGDLLEKFYSVSSATTAFSLASIQHEPAERLSTTPLVLRTNLIEFSKSLGPHHPGCVICGETGAGKTHSATILANIKKIQKGSRTVYLDCRALSRAADVRMRHILTHINELLDGPPGTASSQPVTLIVDNIDVFAAHTGTQTSPYGSAQAAVDVEDGVLDQSKLILDTVGAKITSMCESFDSMFIIITCTTMANLDQFCKDCDLWGSVYTIAPLNIIERSLVFRSSLARSDVACPDHLVPRFEKLTIGYRCRDFDKLALRLRNICNAAPSPTEIEEELHRFVPICRIGVSISLTTDVIKLDDLGALSEAKRLLHETVIRPSRYRRIYDAAKIRLPRGILLYGYPGSGKTALATAVANEGGFSLIVCHGPELLDKYIGASESKVRELFQRAAAAAPSILFFDEFDALAPRRGSDHSGVTDRIVNQLLTFLDGVSDTTRTNEGTVYIVAATSRPDKIDPALLRPGRLEKHIFCGMVDDNAERQDLIEKLGVKYPLDDELANAVAYGDLLSKVRLPAAGLSGADVDAIFAAAHTAAIHEAVNRQAVNGTNPVVTITMDHFRTACDDAIHSIPAAELLRLQSIYSTFSKENY